METEPILFCNIGWMREYCGLVGKNDRLVGGGQWVEDNAYGGEVCNFLPCHNGYIYGYVETVHGEDDCDIGIERLGATSNAAQIDNVDVVWTATHPYKGGRHVVGWYRNATVYRKRQPFFEIPSEQHQKDEIDNYRISTSSGNAILLDEENRSYFPLQSGTDWMGRFPLWYPHKKKNRSVHEFVERVRAAMADAQTIIEESSLPATPRTRTTEVTTRLGQSQFRRQLIDDWQGCALTGCKTLELCEASHIKPWSYCENDECLDRVNGLLLFSSLHRAFDKGLITFSDSGKVRLSPRLTAADRKLLGVSEDSRLRERPSDRMARYLAFHRDYVFFAR